MIARVSTAGRKLAPVVNVLGKVVLLFAATMLLPLVVADLGGDGASAAFHWGMGITGACGLAMILATTGARRELTPRDGYLLADLGSTNGSRVNGLRIGQQLLQDGDEIMIGNTRIGFEAS